MFRWMILVLMFVSMRGLSQQSPSVMAVKWADSVFNTLTEDQRIAQLMIMRMSSMDAARNPVFFEAAVRDAVEKYNIGGICLFQGGPLKQAAVINALQKVARTPLFVSIDAENGLGMRMDSVMGLPRQMMMGAVTDPTLIYEYGKLVGEQCKRIGITINYAPVVDVNNNAKNPVINDRSFGEDKYKVTLFGIHFMRGMQDAGVMAVAKHFPGHGNVDVDSHYDLPVIKNTRQALDSLELYPFRQLALSGVGGMMVAHLFVPAIDNTPNTAASISSKHVTGILKEEFKYNGLVFTDALEMKGVSKFYAGAELSVKALEAGNDVLCLPADIPGSIKSIREAIRKKQLDATDINKRVKKVLLAKYQYGLSAVKPIDLDNLTEDLNEKSEAMRRLIAADALTLLKNDDKSIFPLAKGKKVAYVGIGLDKDNEFARQLREEYDAHVYYFDYKTGAGLIPPLMDLLGYRYDAVVIGVHNFSRFPRNNFGISPAAFSLIEQLQQRYRTITMVFGNPYAMKNLCDNRVLISCYEDDSITHHIASDLLAGRFTAKGKLPVTVCPTMPSGAGIVADRIMTELRPADLGFRVHKLAAIDSIVTDAIKKRAIPGAVVLVAKDGRVAYERSFGFTGYDSSQPVYPETIYDLASITKIMATTLSVMKLYDEGKLILTKRLGDYLPWTRGTNKAKLGIGNILLHQAGLKAWIPFYRETLEPGGTGSASFDIYSHEPDSIYSIRVADHMYMRRDWKDTLHQRILQSSVAPQGIYVYSDLDFIFLGEIVETITGMPLNEYVKKTFFDPLGLETATFTPLKKFTRDRIAPTETESIFRKQLIWGDVHDPGAAMLGGVAGHAGLFGTAYDVAVLSQILLNEGKMKGITFFQPGTVKLFTSYHGQGRRGFGFDKPEKDNHKRPEPYPTLSASPFTFGHTGFTGTSVWIDPLHRLTYVFLSNRVYTNGDAGRFNRMNVRPKVHEVIYESLLDRGPKMQLPAELTQNL